MSEKEKSCYECKNITLCFLRHDIDKVAMNAIKMLSENCLIEIYKAIGSVCNNFAVEEETGIDAFIKAEVEAWPEETKK